VHHTAHERKQKSSFVDTLGPPLYLWVVELPVQFLLNCYAMYKWFLDTYFVDTIQNIIIL